MNFHQMLIHVSVRSSFVEEEVLLPIYLRWKSCSDEWFRLSRSQIVHDVCDAVSDNISEMEIFSRSDCKGATSNVKAFRRLISSSGSLFMDYMVEQAAAGNGRSAHSVVQLGLGNEGNQTMKVGQCYLIAWITPNMIL